MQDNTGLLCVSGADAKKFLQGQLTCNLDDVSDQHAQLGAHCNPQGRMISLFYLFMYQDNYYLRMPREMVAIALKALQKYAVFFKVILTDASNTEINIPPIPDDIPMIYPETSEKFLPHDINLPALNGVSFNKGCYTGQEIIARMQYRGKLKTELNQINIISDVTPKRGEDYCQDGNIIGIIVDYQIIDHNQYKLFIVGKNYA